MKKMNKKYAAPVIAIEQFMTENILTESGVSQTSVFEKQTSSTELKGITQKKSYTSLGVSL